MALVVVVALALDGFVESLFGIKLSYTIICNLLTLYQDL